MTMYLIVFAYCAECALRTKEYLKGYGIDVGGVIELFGEAIHVILCLCKTYDCNQFSNTFISITNSVRSAPFRDFNVP